LGQVVPAFGTMVGVSAQTDRGRWDEGLGSVFETDESETLLWVEPLDPTNTTDFFVLLCHVSSPFMAIFEVFSTPSTPSNSAWGDGWYFDLVLFLNPSIKKQNEIKSARETKLFTFLPLTFLFF
jgi:hypothetical protein